MHTNRITAALVDWNSPLNTLSLSDPCGGWCLVHGQKPGVPGGPCHSSPSFPTLGCAWPHGTWPRARGFPQPSTARLVPAGLFTPPQESWNPSGLVGSGSGGDAVPPEHPRLRRPRVRLRGSSSRSRCSARLPLPSHSGAPWDLSCEMEGQTATRCKREKYRMGNLGLGSLLQTCAV